MDVTRLSLRHITKEYPGVIAVDDVSIDFAPGEIHGLVGENGAGKSTLIKILAGAVKPDEGEIWLNGQLVQLHTVRDAHRHGLAFIHQELNLAPYLDAAENIFLGLPYPKTRWQTIDRRQLRRAATTILQQLGVELPVARPVSRLSPGQQTMIAIARTFAQAQALGQQGAALLVMDEPTAALTHQEIERLFTAIRTLRVHDTTVLYVSHRLEEIFAITDRVTVMRNGRVVHSAPTPTLDQTQLIQQMTGRRTAPRNADPTRSLPNATRPLLAVHALTGPGVNGATFTLHSGEVLGIAGLVGAGRSELLHLLLGAVPRTSGEITLGGARLRLASPNMAIAQGIALVPEERRTQGLLLQRPIFENVTLARVARFARAGFLLDRRRELLATTHQQRQLALKTANLRQPVVQLSGGNQQKVLFARTLVGATGEADLRLLLLDEPTRGIDVGAKEEIYQIIRTQAARGVGIILVSSELPELLTLADRILVLRDGYQVALLDAHTSDQETILRYCYGIQA